MPPTGLRIIKTHLDPRFVPYDARSTYPTVLVSNHAEIIRDSVQSIDRVASTMGVELTEAQRDEVVARSRFSYLKDHESQFAPPLLPFTKPQERPKMVRKGESGKSDEMLDRAQQVPVDRACRGALRKPGSDLPYDREFQVVEGNRARPLCRASRHQALRVESSALRGQS